MIGYINSGTVAGPPRPRTELAACLMSGLPTDEASCTKHAPQSQGLHRSLQREAAG